LPAFISVAPYENSTFAFIPFFFKKSVVKFTSSVAINFPSRSSTFFIFELSGTATTTLTGLKPCFE